MRTFTDGWRGRIGLVATAPGNATEADFNRYRPEGVAVMTTRTPLAASTPEGIRQMNRYAEDAVAMLASNAYCDVVLCSSTAGSFVDGLEADRENAARMSRQYGCTVITSAGCMLAALEAIGARIVTLVTPSSTALNQIEEEFLRSAGITVAVRGGFHLSRPRDILCVQPGEVAELIRSIDTPESEAVLISCSGLHVMEIIPELEQELGKPVIASNQFGLWGSLRAMGIDDLLPGLGKLGEL